MQGILGRGILGGDRPKEIPLVGGYWPFIPPLRVPLGVPPLARKKTRAEQESEARQREIEARWREEMKGPSLVYKSEERQPVALNLDPAHRVAFKFIAAKTPDKMAAFADEFGLPMWGEPELAKWPLVRPPPDDRMLLAHIEVMRKAFEKIVDWYEAGDERAISVLRPDRSLGDLRPVLVKSRGRNPPTLALYARNLLGFMCLELGALVAGNTKVLRCINCGTIFVAGSGTGRKRTAHYCSNRCRVAYQRAHPGRGRGRET
jgi:hypothetical protein